jgi:hypothetical protein
MEIDYKKMRLSTYKIILYFLNLLKKLKSHLNYTRSSKFWIDRTNYKLGFL